MQLFTLVFLISSTFSITSHAAFSPPIEKRFDEMGLTERLGRIAPRMEYPATRQNIDLSLLEKVTREYALFKEIRETSNDALNLIIDMIHEVLVYGKIDPEFEGFNPEHPLGNDLLHLAAKLRMISNHAYKQAELFSTAHSEWANSGALFTTVTHYAQVCTSHAAQMTRKYAIWMNQLDIVNTLDDCSEELTRFERLARTEQKPQVESPDSKPTIPDPALQKMIKDQKMVDYILSRVETNKRGQFGLRSPLGLTLLELVTHGSDGDSADFDRTKRFLEAENFWKHALLLENHLAKLRDQGAEENVITRVEADLFRTHALVTLATDSFLTAEDLTFSLLTNSLLKFGALYGSYKAGEFAFKTLRTAAGFTASKLKGLFAQKDPFKKGNDIDLGIQKRFGAFGPGDGKFIEVDLDSPLTQVDEEAQKQREAEERHREIERQLQEIREEERLKEKWRLEDQKKRLAEQQAQARKKQELQTIEQDKQACWHISGTPFAKEGKPDLFLYYLAKHDLDQSKATGEARLDIITGHWKTHLEKIKQEKEEKRRHAAKRGGHRGVKESQPQDETTRPLIRTVPVWNPSGNDNNEPAPRRNLGGNDNNAPAPHIENQIDWTAPSPAQEKKEKPTSGSTSPSRRGNTLEHAALNEYLFTEGALTWHAQIEQRDPIQDEILEDVLWYAALVFTNAVAENDSLTRTAERFAEDQHARARFTANDSDARVLRGHLAHGFRAPDEIERFVRDLVLPFLGPRIKHFCEGHSNKEELLVDLSRSELFKERELNININEAILKKFQRLERYMKYWQDKEDRMIRAFALLDQQSGGTAVFEPGTLNHRLVAVFPARAIEAVLVQLGELYMLYKAQDDEQRTLPPAIENLLRQLYYKIRKKAVHEVDADHADWHFSPLPSAVVQHFADAVIKLSKLR